MEKPEALLHLAARKGHLPRRARIGVALSGGRDSVALAYAALRLAPSWGWDILLFHYDHRLRPESSEDAAFVKELALRWRLPLVVGRAPRRKGRPWNEARARARRYFFLRRQARRHGVEALLLAHHGGDQVETLLLRLFRGSGPDGMAAMAPRRGRWVRPWLTLLPQELEDYAWRHGLPYREDATNRDPRFARNLVRQRILPLLPALHPSAWESALGAARRLRRERAFWYRESRAALAGAQARGGWKAAEMAAWPWPLFVRAAQLIYAHLRKKESVARGRLLLLRPRLEERHLRAWRLMVKRGKPRGWRGPRGVGVVVRKGIFRGWIPRPAPLVPPPRTVPVPGEVAWPGGRLRVRRVGRDELKSLWEGPFTSLEDRHLCWLDARKVGADSRLLLRAPQPGDTIHPLGSPQRRRVVSLLRREGIAAHERARWPLLEVDGKILWVVGLRAAEVARITPETEEALEFRWVPAERDDLSGMVH